MGCDIHSFAEVRKNGKWEKVGEVFPLDDWDKNYFKKDFGDRPINWRDYSLYGWLADVRNYSCVPAISQPRGIPDDVSPEVAQENNDWADDGHSHSWLSLAELLTVDYEQVFWDRRVTRQEAPNFWNGAALANEGEGKHITLREHLSEGYFRVLETLKTLGSPDDVRIVFWFDN